MTKQPGSVRVAVNVMRARITILGFNIAIITFQLRALPRVKGGTALESVGHSVHLHADTTLFMGLALSLVAMMVFIMSSALDREGVCDHWTLLLGDLLVYLGLAQTVSGFFGPFANTLKIMAQDFPDQHTAMVTVQAALCVAGAIAWFLATYVGPVVTLFRSPFSRAITLANTVAYVLLLLSLTWVSAQAGRLQSARAGEAIVSAPTFPGEFAQPLRWLPVGGR